MKKLLSAFFGTLLMIIPARADIPSIPVLDPSLSDPSTLLPLIGLLVAGGVITGIIITVAVVKISKKGSKKK